MKVPKTGVVLLSLILCCNLCFGQTIPDKKQIDSLLHSLKTAPADTFRLNALHQLGNYYVQRHFNVDASDLDSAIFYFNKELELSKQLHIDEGSGSPEALCSMGEAYISKKQFAEGEACFTQAYDIYKKAGKRKMTAFALNRFGKIAYRSAGGVSPGNLLQKIMDAFEESASIFISIGDVDNEINSYMYMASAHFLYGLYDQADADCARAIKKYPNNSSPSFIQLYYVFAHIQRYRGNLNMALSYALESMRRLEKSHESDKIRTQSLLYGEIALIYDALGQTENSIEWYKKTLAVRENMPIKLEYKYRTAGFIVQGLIRQKKYDEAFAIALGVEKRHPPDNDYNKAIISQIKAYCYEALGDDKKAEHLYLLALKLFGDVKTDEIVSLCKYDVAKFYIKKNDYKKAALYMDEGVSNGMLVTRLRDWNFIFYKIDSANGNYASALQHHIQYKIFTDSIFNIEKNKQIQELQVQYETKQKEKDIRALKKDAVFQNSQTQQARNIRNLALAGSALLIILLVLIYSNFRVKQRSNIMLNALVNEKDDLLKEKEWLIKEIHHRVKNNLQIVMGLLQRQSAYIDNEAALQAIQNSESRMHSIALIHQKLYQSEDLDLINMTDYINELLRYLKESADADNRIQFEKDIDAIDLDISQGVPLGLILNEAITNAIKYAYSDDAGGIIQVSLKRTPGEKITLIIRDYGRGVSEDFDLKQSNSMGMNLMRGLSKQISGTFEMICNDGAMIRIIFSAAQLAKTETSEV
ncbi:MAG TPA: histidine kinase dimerization/phosphoacceptor domain -containing protein [Mucilaginibacter sp.]|nr:histidine kinase dimerization/phosphoacceptor domain -containing protein [Mucilaginibacter sp.]